MDWMPERVSAFWRLVLDEELNEVLQRRAQEDPEECGQFLTNVQEGCLAFLARERPCLG